MYFVDKNTCILGTTAKYACDIAINCQSQMHTFIQLSKRTHDPRKLDITAAPSRFCRRPFPFISLN